MDGVTFLFGPVGSTYVGMGKELYDTFPRFAVVMDKLEAIYEKIKGNSLQALIWGDVTTIDDVEVIFPAVFAIQVALVNLLEQFGVNTSAVIGHSFGEHGAAVAAGVLSADDGFRLVLERARLMKVKTPQGSMTALFCTAERARTLIADFENLNGAGSAPELAVFAAPDRLGLGGTAEQISEFEGYCASPAVAVKFIHLGVSYAHHTSHMEPLMADLYRFAMTLPHDPPKLTFISGVTGGALSEIRPSYWGALTRNQLLYSKALADVVSRGAKVFIEIGASPVLIGLMARNFPENTPKIFAVMERKESNLESFYNCLLALGDEGVNVNWEAWSCAVGDTKTQELQQRLLTKTSEQKNLTEEYELSDKTD